MTRSITSLGVICLFAFVLVRPCQCQALRLALKMEKDVSAKMKEMIDICSLEGGEDYHAADWLTGTWLEEQLTGQRKLAGMINTFDNFK